MGDEGLLAQFFDFVARPKFVQVWSFIPLLGTVQHHIKRGLVFNSSRVRSPTCSTSLRLASLGIIFLHQHERALSRNLVSDVLRDLPRQVSLMMRLLLRRGKQFRSLALLCHEKTTL